MEIKQSGAAGRAGRLLARRKERSHGTLRVVIPDITQAMQAPVAAWISVMSGAARQLDCDLVRRNGNL